GRVKGVDVLHVRRSDRREVRGGARDDGEIEAASTDLLHRGERRAGRGRGETRTGDRGQTWACDRGQTRACDRGQARACDRGEARTCDRGKTGTHDRGEACARDRRKAGAGHGGQTWIDDGGQRGAGDRGEIEIAEGAFRQQEIGLLLPLGLRGHGREIHLAEA